MQKWLPDAFATSESSVAAVVHADDSMFESEQNGDSSEPNDKGRLFLSESGFSGPEAIMGHLTREERAQVFELVEQDVSREFEEQETELRKNMQTEVEELRQGFDAALNSWSENLTQVMAAHMKETADASARLAVKLAEKVIRQKTPLDHDILIRAIETALFKIDGTKSLTVNLNPSQAEWMETQAGLKEKLGIEQIISDRRIDPGGCLIKTHKQEWDATISGQLEYLTEIVEEMITTSDKPDLSGEDAADAEPLVD